VALAAAPFVRPVVARLKHRVMKRLVARTVAAQALPLEEWRALAGEPDGRVISLVGRARGEARLAAPLGGERCIGVALECVDTTPGVVESLYDFDLVDEEGRAIPIKVASGRLFGPPNARIYGDAEGRLLVGSLDLPVGARPTSYALVVRDGDVVEVVGVKTTFVDPTQAGLRQAPFRVGLASSATHPLLVRPIARPATA
jgi:hypothetical protein